jgi:hypothetical protein
VRFPLLVITAIIMAVALWLLVRVVLNPLDVKPRLALDRGISPDLKQRLAVVAR